jgi:hypothetical protein
LLQTANSFPLSSQAEDSGSKEGRREGGRIGIHIGLKTSSLGEGGIKKNWKEEEKERKEWQITLGIVCSVRL